MIVAALPWSLGLSSSVVFLQWRPGVFLLSVEVLWVVSLPHWSSPSWGVPHWLHLTFGLLRWCPERCEHPLWATLSLGLMLYS